MVILKIIIYNKYHHKCVSDHITHRNIFIHSETKPYLSRSIYLLCLKHKTSLYVLCLVIVCMFSYYMQQTV